MDRSECKAIVDREINGMCARLGIGHWRIVVRFDLHNDDGTWQQLGECDRYIDYNRALIRLNPDAFDDEAMLLETLRHELFHILLSPFDIVTNAVTEAVKHDEKLSGVLESIREHAIEKAVINLERMYAGLKPE